MTRRRRGTSEERLEIAKLDRQEKDLLESVERGEWKSVARLKSERKRYQHYAKATSKKDQRGKPERA